MTTTATPTKEGRVTAAEAEEEEAEAVVAGATARKDLEAEGTATNARGPAVATARKGRAAEEEARTVPKSEAKSAREAVPRKDLAAVTARRGPGAAEAEAEATARGPGAAGGTERRGPGAARSVDRGREAEEEAAEAEIEGATAPEAGDARRLAAHVPHEPGGGRYPEGTRLRNTSSSTKRRWTTRDRAQSRPEIS